MSEREAREMREALLADGEKLRQLTGEDHGPWRLCPSCAGEGSNEVPVPMHDLAAGEEYDWVKCEECGGAGYTDVVSSAYDRLRKMQRYAELTAEYEARGISPADASRKAFGQLRNWREP